VVITMVKEAPARPTAPSSRPAARRRGRRLGVVGVATADRQQRRNAPPRPPATQAMRLADASRRPRVGALRSAAGWEGRSRSDPPNTSGSSGATTSWSFVQRLCLIVATARTTSRGGRFRQLVELHLAGGSARMASTTGPSSPPLTAPACAHAAPALDCLGHPCHGCPSSAFAEWREPRGTPCGASRSSKTRRAAGRRCRRRAEQQGPTPLPSLDAVAADGLPPWRCFTFTITRCSAGTGNRRFATTPSSPRLRSD
jgi:hypothetical protein